MLFVFVLNYKSKKHVFPDDRPVISKKIKANILGPRSNFPSTSKTEDNVINNHHLNNPIHDKILANEPVTFVNHVGSSGNISSLREEDKPKPTTFKIKKLQKLPQITTNTDDSENSSEERGNSRKERKPLPLIFNQSRSGAADNNDSSSETSEDTKETDSCKCVYLGERETLRSFWDKCLYQCFKSKRCVAGEKPKRKYRKKPKKSKVPTTKRRKSLDLPLSCIDTEGTAGMTHKG